MLFFIVSLNGHAIKVSSNILAAFVRVRSTVIFRTPYKFHKLPVTLQALSVSQAAFDLNTFWLSFFS